MDNTNVKIGTVIHWSDEISSERQPRPTVGTVIDFWYRGIVLATGVTETPTFMTWENVNILGKLS